MLQVVSWAVPGNTPGQIRLDSRSESKFTTVGRYQGGAFNDFTRIEFTIANFSFHDLGTYTIRVNNSVAGAVLTHNVTSEQLHCYEDTVKHENEQVDAPAPAQFRQ